MNEQHVDVLIFGGGIAGLWTLARLRNEGFSCLLLESKSLGSAQTGASQGIIHGGLKYALGGESTEASRAIAEMPGIWQACLQGEGELDLRSVRVLSGHQYLWTAPGIIARIAGFAATKVLRTTVEPVAPGDRPAALRESAAQVYRVNEPVVDTLSAVSRLAELGQGRMARIEFPGGVRLDATGPVETGGTHVRGVDLFRPKSQGGGIARRFTPRCILLAAGEGNAALMESANVFSFSAVPQLRPLHMVMLRWPPASATEPHVRDLYAHCIGASTAASPRLTITTGSTPADRSSAPQTVWYIGGELAEKGVDRSEREQIEAARNELQACMPWLKASDLQSASWATLRINRAEGISPDDRATGKGTNTLRPDLPTIVPIGNVIAGWPTKLAFAPMFAAKVLTSVRDMGITPSGNSTEPTAHGLEAPTIAPPPWAAAAAAEGSVKWT